MSRVKDPLTKTMEILISVYFIDVHKMKTNNVYVKKMFLFTL